MLPREPKVRDVAMWSDGTDWFLLRTDKLLYRNRDAAWLPVASLRVGLGEFCRWLQISRETAHWAVAFLLPQSPITASKHLFPFAGSDGS